MQSAATANPAGSNLAPIGHKASQKPNVLIVERLFFYAKNTRLYFPFSKYSRLGFWFSSFP